MFCWLFPPSASLCTQKKTRINLCVLSIKIGHGSLEAGVLQSLRIILSIPFGLQKAERLFPWCDGHPHESTREHLHLMGGFLQGPDWQLLLFTKHLSLWYLKFWFTSNVLNPALEHLVFWATWGNSICELFPLSIRKCHVSTHKLFSSSLPHHLEGSN